ncbi:MAG: hypothetical protein KGY67_07855 [Candidatus Thermoplasmatota archaeon]|nr:hypothetical protein [Candidatus Thermoplasmatota archaeon]
MNDSEYNKLYEFGEKVQSTSKNKDVYKKRVSLYFNSEDIKKRAVNIFYGLRSFILKIMSKFFLLIKRLMKNTIEKITFLKHKVFSNHILTHNSSSPSDESSIIVEYQKQWMNTSVIIRRRKKKTSKDSSNDAIPFPPSKAVAYYFHRIDTQEDEHRTSFSPRFSLWDFPYKKQHNSFVNWLKHFF